MVVRRSRIAPVAIAVLVSLSLVGCGRGSSSAVIGSVASAAAPAGTVFADEFDGTTLGSAWVALDRHGDASNCELRRRAAIGSAGVLGCVFRARKELHTPFGGINSVVTSRLQTRCYGPTRMKVAGNAQCDMRSWKENTRQTRQICLSSHLEF